MIKKRLIIIALQILFITCLYHFSFGETIKLKSGSQVEGRIVERTNEYIKVNFGGVTATYPLDTIESINDKNITNSAVAISQEAIKNNDKVAGSKFMAASWGDLFSAIDKGSIEEVKSVLRKGVDLNKSDIGIGHTPLVHAIQKGNLEIVKCLIGDGANINEVNMIGMTPLHVAVDQERLDITKYLVENGANLNAKEMANGHTPLMRAILAHNFDIVSYLVTIGANVNEKDNSGRTVLDIAKMWGTAAIANYLSGGASEERLVATDLLVTAAKNGDLEGIKSALSKGADINKKMFRGRPIFVDVVTWKKSGIEKSKLDIAKHLIENGADVNLKDDDGLSPFIHMVNWNHFDLVKILIEKGANIEKDEMDKTLRFAARNGNSDMFIYLLEKGGDVKKGMQVFIAVADGIDFKQEVSPSKLKIIDYSIEKGADINEKNEQGWTALTYAAINCSPQLAKYLIDRGAKIDEKNNKGMTSLMIAVTQHCFEIVECLVENGADINVRDEQGKTALDIAHEAVKNAKEKARFGLAYKIEESTTYKIENYLKSKISR